MSRTPRNRKERERDVRVIVQESPQEIAALAETLQERQIPKRTVAVAEVKKMIDTNFTGPGWGQPRFEVRLIGAAD